MEHMLDFKPAVELDMYVTLSNLLENALEVSLRMEPAGRTVRIRGEVHG